MKRYLIGFVAAIGLLGACQAFAFDRTYATWDAADANPAILISGDDLTVSRTVEGTEWAAIRATIGVESGAWYWETTYQHDGAADLVAGIAKAATPLFLDPRGAPQSPLSLTYTVVGPYSNGACYAGGAPAQDGGTGPVATGTVVRYWLDLDSYVFRAARGSDDWLVLLSGADLQLAVMRGLFYPVAGLLRPSGSSVSMTANFGSAPFVYEVPIGANPGIYVDDPIMLSGFELNPLVDAAWASLPAPAAALTTRSTPAYLAPSIASPAIDPAVPARWIASWHRTSDAHSS